MPFSYHFDAPWWPRLGVPGPLRGALHAGRAVTLPDGTVVQPSQVRRGGKVAGRCEWGGRGTVVQPSQDSGWVGRRVNTIMPPLAAAAAPLMPR